MSPSTSNRTRSTPRASRAANAALLSFLATIVLAVGGCKDPYVATAPPKSSVAPTADAQAAHVAKRTHEVPARSDGHLPRPPTGSYLPTSARAAVQGFAERFINWTYSTLHARQLDLARYSTGAARDAIQLAAQSTTHDNELKAGQVTNTGTVVSLAPSSTSRAVWIVVTRERTSSQSGDYEGLKPAYHVTLARATQPHPGRYAISSWQPQN